jgi:hypothetical protein|tara:strand:- start:95 stop:280 length:186 start_codon:yes stop_codon:yes gene_type:complete
MEELLKDRSTPIWVLELGHQLKEIDIVDAINGLEAVTDALRRDFEKMIATDLDLRLESYRV